MSGIRHAGLLAWLHLIKVNDKMQRKATAQLAAYGLTLAQFDVLVQLHLAPGITQQELAERMLVSKGNVCGLIDRIAAHGWVERGCHPEDRRANLLNLTAAGRELIEEALPAHEEFVQRQMAALSDGDQRVLLALLRELDRSFSRCEH